MIMDGNILTLREQENAALLPRVTTRKIGGTTFLVTSRANDGKSRDLAAAIARLIERDESPCETPKTAG